MMTGSSSLARRNAEMRLSEDLWPLLMEAAPNARSDRGRIGGVESRTGGGGWGGGGRENWRGTHDCWSR